MTTVIDAARERARSHPVDAHAATFGERLAEQMATHIGSWRFLIIQSIFLASWVALNTVSLVTHWDDPPYILLNLMLSFQAAYTGPVLLIAANRAATRDRALALHDHELAQEQEEILQVLHTLLDRNTQLTEECHALLVAARESLS